MIDVLSELIGLVVGSAPLTWAATGDQEAAHAYESKVTALLDRLQREHRALVPFKHFKGGVYVQLGTATFATGTVNAPVELVLYRKQGASAGELEGPLYARTLPDWMQVVPWSDGVHRPRFIPLEDAP